ncbi:AzlD domain-containing protein [Jonesia quinghaiensis]|uniref:AzlD domain-containing protein n=1 Tax=Jonesia quinghaiensis TaxID=262806 RepID=UPI00040F9C60|nr:AzlD domain-containing protein [Jonesia quinghaiensis]
MTMWVWIVCAAALSYAVKLAGYLLPDSWFDDPRVITIANHVTVGLLAGLVITNALSSGEGIHADARLGALVVAFIALLLRAPFLVVVIAGTLAAALLRAIGFP